MYKEVILFLTGKLAEKQLAKILENMSVPSPCKKPPEWNYRVKQLLDEPKVDSEVFNVFTSVDNLFDTNIFS